MPKQKQKQKKKTKSKNKKGKGASVTPSRGPGTVVPAPVNYGGTRNSGSSLRFAAGSRAGCMRISGNVQVGTLQMYNDGTTSALSILLGTTTIGTSGGMCSQFMVMPQNSRYFSTPVYLFAQLFQRFKMKTRLEFRTRMATSDRGAIKVVYVEDPAAFYANTGKTCIGNIMANQAASGDFAGYPDVFEGSVWLSWKTGWSHQPPAEDYRYIAGPSYNALVNPATNTDVSLRQSISGSWLVAQTGVTAPTAGTATYLGELWVEYELELCDLMTFPMTVVDGFSMRKPAKDQLDRLAEAVASKLERKERSCSPSRSTTKEKEWL